MGVSVKGMYVGLSVSLGVRVSGSAGCDRGLCAALLVCLSSYYLCVCVGG